MAEKESEAHEATEQKEQNSDGGKAAKLTKNVLTFALIVFVWYLFADRFTPYTDNARGRRIAFAISPRVSGYVTGVYVKLHEKVKRDQLLFQLDKKPYELAVERAKAHLDNVSQQVAAMTASVKAAAARLGMAKAQLDRAQRNYDRTQQVLKKNPGALSQADLDQTETALAQALERVSSAEADLERAKQKLGTSGPENAQLREAIVALEQAEYDLACTTIYAPSDGVIESLNFGTGYYAAKGKPLVMFLPNNAVWLQANYRENNISRMRPGDKAEFTLDIAPGRVFEGKVKSIGYGVNYGESASGGSLPRISTSQGWLREPQRFPVVIEISDTSAVPLIRNGGQADVVVYTSDFFLLRLIARLQIRISGLLSYVR